MSEDGTRRFLFPWFDGKYIEIKDKKVTNALPYIERRIGYYMPIDTIDVEEMLKIISFVRVNPNRDCTPAEVVQIVESIKTLLVDAIAHMPKHQRYLSEKGGRNDGGELKGNKTGGKVDQRDDA